MLIFMTLRNPRENNEQEIEHMYVEFGRYWNQEENSRQYLK